MNEQRRGGQRPVLPVWPAVPILRAPVTHEGFFTGEANADGCGPLWGSDEFQEEAKQYIREQVPGTHESRSAEFFLRQMEATTGFIWQVQDWPGLSDAQQASVDAGCMTARMYGAGLSGWGVALSAASKPWKAVLGGAFSNDNYGPGGVVTWHGVTADEVLGILRNALTKFIRAGGIMEP